MNRLRPNLARGNLRAFLCYGVTGRGRCEQETVRIFACKMDTCTMTTATVNSNAFEALCDLASKEEWCWRFFCTTCGHMYFRYGFRELAHGKHPHSLDWRSGRVHHHDLHRDLGPMPPVGGWPISEQRAIAVVLAGASLKDIASHVRFPDWLGYLGWGLLCSESFERRERLVTKAWIPQLIEMLPEQTHSRATLQELLNDPAGVLTWRHLEGVESGLLQARWR